MKHININLSVPAEQPPASLLLAMDDQSGMFCVRMSVIYKWGDIDLFCI